MCDIDFLRSEFEACFRPKGNFSVCEMKSAVSLTDRFIEGGAVLFCL